MFLLFWMGWDDGIFLPRQGNKKRRSQVPEAKHFTQQQLHVVEFSCLLLLVVRSHAAKGEELWRSSLFMLVVLKAVFWPWLHFLSSDCMLGHLDFPNVLWNTESPLHKRCFLIFFAHVYIIYVCMCVWKATFVFSVLFDMFLFPKSRMPETKNVSAKEASALNLAERLDTRVELSNTRFQWESMFPKVGIWNSKLGMPEADVNKITVVCFLKTCWH